MTDNANALDFYASITSATSPIVLHPDQREQLFKNMLLTAVVLGADTKSIDIKLRNMNAKLATPFDDKEIYTLSTNWRDTERAKR